MNAPLVLAVALALLLPRPEAALAEVKFRPDDPLARDGDDLPIPKPGRIELSNAYDVLEHTLARRPRGPFKKAVNVNTLDEVPDSSWFTNRIGVRDMTPDELAKGPDSGDGPDRTQPLTVISGKSGGVTPGFVVRDGRGDIYFLKFDPPAYPSISTATDVVGTKFFHAFGYHVPENYIAYFRRDQLVVGPTARVSVRGAKKRKMTGEDLDRILEDVGREPDGRIRAVASKAVAGEDLGPHKYSGTRSDDPNDIFAHEDRRDLRGLRVFSAWLSHDDTKSLNSLDVYVPRPEGGYVRHGLIDFGSALGSSAIAPAHRAEGNEYLLDLGPILKTAFSLGLWERPWRRLGPVQFPEVGRFEADLFRPEAWKPHYPNPAFEHMRPDDAFWAAKIVARFSDEGVRAMVHTGGYRDPAAEKYLADTLIRRRDKVVAYYFSQVNPIDGFHVSTANGASVLAFANLGERAGLGKPSGYDVEWFAFDNATGRRTPLGAPASSASAELSVPAHDGEFLLATIHTRGGPAKWAKAVEVYLRGPAAWTVVGIEREN